MSGTLISEHYGMSGLQQEALAYWQKQAKGRAMPARRDIEFLDIPKIMSHAVIFDVLTDPKDFRYRLVGTKVTENTFGDYTGRTLRDMEGKGPGSRIWGALERCVREGRALFEEVPYVGPRLDLARSTMLFLPLADAGQPVNMILLAVAFHGL